MVCSLVVQVVALLEAERERKEVGWRGPLRGVDAGSVPGCPLWDHLRLPCHIQALKLC